MRIGIDVGGTTVKAALCSDDGTLLRKDSLPTRTGDADGVRADMKTLALGLCQAHGCAAAEVTAIGIGVPGSFDKKTCTLRFGTNLGLNNVSFADAFEPEFTCPVHLDNDANCAALGEATAGAAKGVRDMLMVTLGTGVGGGIIANGQLVRGVHFTAGEYSFVNTNAEAWDAPDQNMACQCSTRNLLIWYRARKALPEDAPLDGRSFFAAANAGEPEALEVLRRFCHAVAVQIFNLTVLLDVEKVAIGGGISKQPLLLESLRSAYDGLFASRAGQAYMEGLPRCQIVPCAFSSEANQVGVAAAYFEAMQKKC